MELGIVKDCHRIRISGTRISGTQYLIVELYTLFSSRPDLLFKCAGIEISGTYEMKSVTFKEFEQRSDGLLEPVSGEEPVYIA